MILKGVNLLEDGRLEEKEDDFAMASEFGFDYIEPNLGANVERRVRRAEAEVVREYAEIYNLALGAHLPWVEINVGSPREHVRRGSIEEMKAYIDIAAEMGASTAVMHLSSEVHEYPGWDRDYVLALIIDAVAELDEYAAARGVELTVENKQSFVTAADMVEVLDQTDVAMTFDTGHAHCSGMDSDDMAAYIETHGDRIAELHLNDTRGARDEHLPLGAGRLDMETILRPVRETDWSGNVLLDLSVLDYDYVRISKERLDQHL